MKKINLLLKISTLLLLLSLLSHSGPVFAQEEDTGLCPDGYNEGIVETGFVECYRESTRRTDRADAEFDRLEREAVCLAEPRSAVTSSEIIQDSNGRYYSRITCTITRVVPADTVLCPADSDEIYRAFDTLVCQYFGSASITMPAAQAVLADNVTACSSASGGTVINSRVFMAEGIDDQVFFYSNLSCAFAIPATNVFECPVGFDERTRTEDMLECRRFDTDFATQAEASAAQDNVEQICTGTTAGLGTIGFTAVSPDTSVQPNTFFSEVNCLINLPRYGEFRDDQIVRACDATCTEDIQQIRNCLNGGVVGGPGCIEPDTQIITEDCNTGTDINSACPVLGIPAANIVPLILLDDEEEEDE